MSGKEIRKEARERAKCDYIILFILMIIPIVLQYGFRLAMHVLAGGNIGFGTVAVAMAVGLMMNVFCLWVPLSSYRFCGKRVGEQRLGKGRLGTFFLFYLMLQIPAFLWDCVSLFLRFAPMLFSWDEMQAHAWFGGTQPILSWMCSLFNNLGVQMVLFPALLLFAFYPDRGSWAAFRDGVPLGFRRWPSIVGFRVRTYVIPTIICLLVSRLVGTAVYSALAPSMEELLEFKSIMDIMGPNPAIQRAQFWSNWFGGLVSGVIMAVFLPYLRMADAVFARERLGLLREVEP